MVLGENFTIREEIKLITAGIYTTVLSTAFMYSLIEESFCGISCEITVNQSRTSLGGNESRYAVPLDVQ
jgi:hypothetical protein